MKIDIETLRKLEGHQFEDLIEQLLIKMGFTVKGRSRAADGGIDMIAVSEDPIIKGDYIIQCKRYNNPVSSPTVRDLYGVVTAKAANKGILITTSRYTTDALEFALNKPLELIDWSQLQNLLIKHELLEFAHDEMRSEISEGTRILYDVCFKHITQIIDKADRITDGREYSPLMNVDIHEYSKIIEKQFVSKVEGAIYSLKTLLTELVNVINDTESSSEEIASFRKGCKEINRIATSLVAVQKEMCKVLAPTQYGNAHNIAKQVIPELLENIWKIVEWSRIAVFEGNSSIDKTFNPLQIDALDRLTEEISSLNKKSNKGSTCFIASAVYSDGSVELEILRRFRDEFLLSFLIGRVFVRVYERISPNLALRIGFKEWRKILVRRILRPMILTARIINRKFD